VSGFFRLALYYTHYQCLGHTARVLTILKNISLRYAHAKIYRICASPPQEYIKKNLSFEDRFLPLPLYNRTNFFKLPVSDGFGAAIRARACLDLIKGASPDIFFTEYFPLGRQELSYELLPVLCYLRKTGRKICASAGYPVVPQSGLKKFRQLARFYHKIFIHAPVIEARYLKDTYKNRLERKRYWEIFNGEDRSAISFTNYILPLPLAFGKPFDKKIILKTNRINIAVTRGAGAYYSRIITAAIGASELLGGDYYFTIVAGPATTNAEWLGFRRLMARKKIKNVAMIKATGDMHRLIKESDLCVSAAPYNTSVLLMYYGKKAVLVPFEGYGGTWYREQTARARLLEDVLGAKVIKYTDLSSSRLAYRIRKGIESPHKVPAGRIDQEWFCGMDIFLEEFAKLVA